MLESVGDEKSVDSVRSLERGLRLLRAMNENPRASVTELGRRVGVPRSTVYRLLDTLESLGYVGRHAGSTGFRLSRQVQSLSAGFLDEEWIDAAWPQLVALGEDVLWPLCLFTFETGSMAIRRTTHERSAMSIDYGMMGRRLPITETASGRTYLAFCPLHERDWLIDLPEVARLLPTAADRELLIRQLDQIAHDGYGTRAGGLMPKTSSISVPVMIGQKVLCCISVIWIKSALPHERAVAELAPRMKAAAANLERTVAALL